MLRLTVRPHGMPERLFETAETQVSIGRGLNNLLILDNPHISSQHARVDLTEDGAMLADVGSTNGSMIQRGGSHISIEAGGAAVRIEVGDAVILGDSEAPVVLVLLDDSLGGDTHPALEPPTTAISQAPVDPSAGGIVTAKRPAAKFLELSAERVEQTGFGRAIFDLLASTGQAEESELVETAATAVLALCPAVSHIHIQLISGDHGEVPLVHRSVRGGGDAPVWDPAAGIQIRTVIAREAWLLSGPRIDQPDGDPVKRPRVPAAICAPVLMGESLLGYFFVDNRGTKVPLEGVDLGYIAALAQLLGTVLGATRALLGARAQQASGDSP